MTLSAVEEVSNPAKFFRFGNEPIAVDVLPGLHGLDFDAAWENRAEGVVDSKSWRALQSVRDLPPIYFGWTIRRSVFRQKGTSRRAFAKSRPPASLGMKNVALFDKTVIRKYARKGKLASVISRQFQGIKTGVRIA
jgi:hypothetical protein